MSAETPDPRPAILSSIDIDVSRIELAEEPIVLLCGGSVPLKDHPEDPDLPVASLRDAISRARAPYEIFRPEEITIWHHDGIYKNLLHFEADLASICSLVVVILESAGSLVELGAFSQFPDLSKKLIVIKSSTFKDDPSFINLGILRYITEHHETGVKSYPWDLNYPQNIEAEIVEDAISDIKEELEKLGKSYVLKPSESAHIIVLICEIIRLFTALKEGEIFEYLQIFQISLTKEQLRSKLFLLEQFRLIKKEIYSDSTFYIRSSVPYHRLRISSKSSSAQDPFRIEMECMAYYNKDPKHRHRVRAITQARGQKR